jgi:hypothetical protein
MNIHPNFRVSWLLFTVPFVSTLGISIAPSQAATFASSTTLVNLTNFSANAESSLVSVDAAARAISPVGSTVDLDTLDDFSGEESIAAEAANGDVIATADFSTIAFFPSETSGNNSSLVSSEIDNEALGRGGDYLGKSNTESTVLANFFLNPDAGESEIFSFDFNIFFGLETFASQDTEFSSSTADVSLSVCGRASLDENPLFCDSLSTFGSLSNVGTTTAFAFQNSAPFSIDVLNNSVVSNDSNFQQADFFALGSYQREFDTPIYLTLTEVQYSEAIVSTPEPSTTIAFFSFSAVIMALKKKKK